MLCASLRRAPGLLALSSTTRAAARFRSHTAVFACSTMAAKEYDLVTIGAGSGGVRASRFAAQYYNAKVAVVELPFGFVSSDDIGGALMLYCLKDVKNRNLMLADRHTSTRVLLSSAAGQTSHSFLLSVAQPYINHGRQLCCSHSRMHTKSVFCHCCCAGCLLNCSGAGGTCVIRGCVPKKLLVYGAMFNEEFNDAIGFGWMAQRPPHDWKCKSHSGSAPAAAAPVAAGPELSSSSQ